MPASEKKVAYNRGYNERSYDRVNLLIPKGRLADLKKYASDNDETLNSLANKLFQKTLGLTDEQWKAKPQETDE